MLFFLVFYALIMYAHAYTLHDVLLLYNTTNLRILSPLGGDSEKREFRICDYCKSINKEHQDPGQKINKTGNLPKFQKKILLAFASNCENRSTFWNLRTSLLLNVHIWWTAPAGNSYLHQWVFVLSVFLKWIYYGANGCHHHDADKKRHLLRGFRHPTVSTEPVT